MKKTLILGSSLLCILLLSSCSNANKTSVKTDDKKIEKKDIFLTIKSGVTDGEILGDSQDYANISGTSKFDDEVFLIDAESGLAHGMSKVVDGKFSISCNMQGAGRAKVYLTNDKGLKLYKNDVSKLKNKISLIFIPNEKATSNNSSSSKSSSEESKKSSQANDTPFKIGETANFKSGLSVTVNSIENSSEEPNSPIQGHLVKLSFTIENKTGVATNFNSHLVSLYDGKSLKANLDSKDFYSEEIANGMKSTGVAYYDAANDGPYTAIVGAATFK